VKRKKSSIFSILLYSLIILPMAACTQDVSTESASAPQEDEYFGLPTETGNVVESEELNFQVQTVVQGLDIPWGMTFCRMDPC
jgi:glucose/arabinose dehydrogenase